MEVLDDRRLFRILPELKSGQLLYPLGSAVPEDVSREFAGIVQKPYVHPSGVVDIHRRVVGHVAGWDETLDFTSFHLKVHVSELHNRRCLPGPNDCE